MTTRAPSHLKAAILVVSDTASRDPSTDACTDALKAVFCAADGPQQWVVSDTSIRPDDVLRIQGKVMQWTDGEDDGTHLVVTTGGTGFAIGDHTPEAIAPLLHKQAPGLVHAMLAASLNVTPFAMMSRPVAGVRNKTVILTLPGSPKGAVENLQAVLKLLPHACIQAAGANSRELHLGGIRNLEKEAGVESGVAGSGALKSHGGHCHVHGHTAPIAHTRSDVHPRSNDLSQGPAKRHRTSQYTIVSTDEAASMVASKSMTSRSVPGTVGPNLLGCVLAEDVKAVQPVPAFRASIVDGYAIVAEEGMDTKGVFPVVSVSHAAPGEGPPIITGQIARITTGAPLPPGATAVVMVEDTVLRSRTPDGKEEKDVEILAAVKPGENAREIGSDVQAGETILRKGDEISSVGGELGLLVSVGRREVQVYWRPVVGVLSTGDELVEHDDDKPLRPGQVRDSNRPTLLAAIRAAGFEAVDLGIARDQPGTLERTLRSALAMFSVIVTTGGVSMGELDLLKPTVERKLGGTIHFGRVAMKPGKPTTFATIPNKLPGSRGEDALLFALPGNPASALVTLQLFVLPSLRRTAGIQPAAPPQVPVVLDHDIRPDAQRTEFHRGIVNVGEDGRLHASSTGGQRSSRVGSLRGANALLVFPPGKEPVQKGSRVGAILIGGAPMLG